MVSRIVEKLTLSLYLWHDHVKCIQANMFHLVESHRNA